MIDGISIVVTGVPPERWENSGLLNFKQVVSSRTGRAVDGVKEAEYCGLTFKMSPQQFGGCRLTVKGSLHRYKNGGSANTTGFSFADLQNVIANLRENFGIDPAAARIDGMEFGLNLELPYSVRNLLYSAISYKAGTFEAINGRRPQLGKICSFGEFEIKLYDKVLQSKDQRVIKPLPANLLRFEVEVVKMRWLKNGETFLSDFTEWENYSALYTRMFEVVGKMVFVDVNADLSRLTQKERARYGLWRDRDKWATFLNYQRRNSRAGLGSVLKKCNAFNYQKDIAQRVDAQRRAEQVKQEKLSHFHRFRKVAGSTNFVTSSPFKCLRENVTVTTLEQKKTFNKNLVEKATVERRCKSCGSDISYQRRGSGFCSEKYKGGQAKQCRNRDSNTRRDKRSIINRAKMKGQFLRINYMYKGVMYTDTLHSSEVSAEREWLDSVVSVEAVDQSQESARPFIYSDARDFIAKLSIANAKRPDSG